MQVPIPLFTNSIAWLEANTFITAYGRHSLTRRISWKTTNVVNTLQTIDCSNIRREDTHIKRDIDNKLIFLNVWHHLNVYLIKQL